MEAHNFVVAWEMAAGLRVFESFYLNRKRKYKYWRVTLVEPASAAK